MASLGKIITSEYKKIQGAPGKSLVINFEGIDDANCEQYHTPGVFGKPIKNTNSVIINIGGYKIGIGTCNYDLDDKNIESGETLLYSLDADGNIKSSIVLDKTGKFIFNDGNDNAVRFSILETEFNKLRDAWDDFAADYAPGSPSSTGTPASAAESNADLSGAKITEIEVP